MDRDPSGESIPAFNFLDEDAFVTHEVDDEAKRHLPKVMEQDIQTGRERYGVLTGFVKRRGLQRAHVVIKGVYQETDDDAIRSYTEGVAEVNFDLNLMKRKVRQIQKTQQAYKDFHFIGDVHTHPISGIAKPSPGDLTAGIEAYESGDMRPDEPYIFAIGQKEPDGMLYRFYRMVRTDSSSGYGFAELD